MRKSMIIMVLATFASCNGQDKKADQPATKEATQAQPKLPSKFKVVKTDAEWKNQLTPEQYNVLRQKGTERPHTGEYAEHFEKGTYVCAACGNKLFDSGTKFHSDCGWPSFDQAIKGSVIYEHDGSYGWDRTEVMCANCGGHLGHVFDDGPEETTGKRFCTNSVSIKFIPAEEK
nr:peptide-methionine (R)-S-oxide reductase MsrB [Flavobacterium akiainvivens]